jgi:hypothetical protein
MVFDDEKVRELRRAVDEHARGGRDPRALQALEGLGAVRTDFAMLHIHAIATRTTGKLKKRAEQILGDVCRQRGLSDDELEDRIVPDLGLDERGAMTLDYGARRFTVGFDELLRPFVRDEGGARLVGLPHVSKSDDTEKAVGAQAAWKALKDDVKMIGAEQSRRLERSMVNERTWSADALAKHLVAHRLIGHLARRLVFGVLAEKEIRKTFRVAEDGTFADERDAAIALDPSARVVIVHPARIEEPTRAAWGRVFDDYKIMQTFPQLARERVELSPTDLASPVTVRFKEMRAHGGSFFALRKRGWTAEWNAVSKPLMTGVRATLALEPGMTSFASKPEDQTLGALRVLGRTFSALAPIVRFELLRDVQLLVAKD